MGIKYSSKINKIRTFALILIFAGIFLMYIGLLFQTNQILVYFMMGIGFISIILSACVYFWIGILSSKTVKVVCPTCKKHTKILGRVDACMYCRQPLTLDKALEGMEFDEKYNRRKM